MTNRHRNFALSGSAAALVAFAFALSSCQTSAPNYSASNGSPQTGAQFASNPAPAPPASQLGPPPSVNAAAYVVINARTGEVLASRNPHQPREVASTQKLLTALVLLDNADLDRTITVDASDTWVEPTKIGLVAGQRYKKGDLLQAMLVRSSNDIARCLARSHAGSEAAFAQQMNRKAAELGMRNSRFANASGLSAGGQYSTAYDLSILATHAMNNSYIHRVTQTREVVFRFPDGSSKLLSNTNKLLRTSPYCCGMKTGYTAPAGRCLVSCGKKDFKKVIVVVLGSSVPDIWTGSQDLLHWALEVDRIPPA